MNQFLCLTQPSINFTINVGKIMIHSLTNRYWTFFSLAILTLSAIWIALTTIYAPSTTQGRVPAPRPGFLAPDFTLQTFDGQMVSLSQFHGQPVILNLWASWCPPCKAEMPAIQQVYSAYQNQGLVVLGVNMTSQDDIASAQRFAKQAGVTFPVLLDQTGEVARSYEMRALPTTVFIDQNGMIQDLVVGGPLSKSMLRSKALQLLEAK